MWCSSVGRRVTFCYQVKGAMLMFLSCVFFALCFYLFFLSHASLSRLPAVSSVGTLCVCVCACVPPVCSSWQNTKKKTTFFKIRRSLQRHQHPAGLFTTVDLLDWCDKYRSAIRFSSQRLHSFAFFLFSFFYSLVFVSICAEGFGSTHDLKPRDAQEFDRLLKL